MASTHTGQIGELAYEITQHPPDDGLALTFELAQVAARPLLEVLERGIKAQDSLRAWFSENAEEAPTWDTLLKALDGVELSGIGAEVQAALAAYPDAAGLVRRLLTHTTYRAPGMIADAPVVVGGRFALYFSGRYLVLLRLAWESIRANGFLLLLGTS